MANTLSPLLLKKDENSTEMMNGLLCFIYVCDVMCTSAVSMVSVCLVECLYLCAVSGMTVAAAQFVAAWRAAAAKQLTAANQAAVAA